MEYEKILPQHKGDSLKQTLEKLMQKGIPDFWDDPLSNTISLSVPGGALRCFHFKPPKADSIRPFVFIPGFGALAGGFKDFYSIIRGRSEGYYLETREKDSSAIAKKGSDMSITQSARDIALGISHFGLDSSDYVLVGTCWGSSIISHGIHEGILNPPTVILFDPMHRLWFPRGILEIAPLVPDWLLGLIKPGIQSFVLSRLEEGVQKERTRSFLDSAVLWKWRRSAYEARNFDLLKIAPSISREILVVNGTGDAIHNQEFYPRIAGLMKKGRFLYLPIPETHRESLMGYVTLLFTKQERKDPIPYELRESEVILERASGE